LKIGLIGNMNNNNFTLMRYFRDLGADAHLLLYSNDGVGDGAHFVPSADTWNMQKWSPFIHRTDIPNTTSVAFGYPLSELMRFRTILQNHTIKFGKLSNRKINTAYGGYNKLVASGSTPIALARTGRKLDLFYPYSIGVEFLDSKSFSIKASGSWYRKTLINAVRKKQISGIKKAQIVVCSDNYTKNVLSSYGIDSINMTFPMVYNNEEIPDVINSTIVATCINRINLSRFSILHHSRLMWKRKEYHDDIDFKYWSKNSDWTVRAFAEFTKLRPELNPLLLIVEYGDDVNATKDLILELGIAKQVLWLPIMDRRETAYLLKRVTVAIGEFYDIDQMIWGGTGWEALAAGVPLLQSFRFKEGEFGNLYGHPPPKLLDVRSKTDILNHFILMANDDTLRKKIGRESVAWFNKYNGITLARRWLDLLNNSKP
jgi:hypothetical protein